MKRFTEKRYLIHKRIITTVLSLIMTLTLSVPCMPAVPVHAAEFVGIGVAEAVGSGAMASGMISGISGATAVLGLVTAGVEFYNALTHSGKQGNINTYYYQGGDTYNTTINYKVFNDYTKNTTVTSNYNYSFYNPVTNNYNYTNDYSYNPQYNTYYYTTNEGNKTVNNYVTDNTTNVSYYIVSTDKTTGEKFESYYEIYFELPDGRNSYNLKKEDILGQYFIYDYSKYQSVPEDDGKTLGLWHLDGNLKDSSYYGNTSGFSYTSTYKDARYEGGKYLGVSDSDYFQLNLNKVTLPSSYTLEWVQYVPNNSAYSVTLKDKEIFKESKITSEPMYLPDRVVAGLHLSEISLAGIKYQYYDYYFTKTNYLYTGVSGFKDTSILCKPRYNSLEHYAIVKDGGTYTYYVNGVKTACTSNTYIGGGVEINNDKIKFYVGSRTDNLSVYSKTASDRSGGFTEGLKPTSSNFHDYNYNVYKRYDEYTRNQYTTFFNRDTIIDEVRLSKGAIYTDNFTPSTQPYTTNTVLVTPSNPKENEISFKTNYELGNVRIGGARPTYPTTGDIFVNIEDDKVDSIQQYQETGWYSITGAIYRNGKWSNLKDFNMKEYVVKEPCHCDTLCTSDSINKDCSACSDDWKQCSGKPVCICDDRCEPGSINRKCPVCSKGWDLCTGTLVCHCDLQCTSDFVNVNCYACSLDLTKCTGTPVCRCDVRCTSDSINRDCPICSNDWKQCSGLPSDWPVCSCEVRCTSDSVNRNCPLCGLLLDDGVEIFDSDTVDMIRSRKFDKGTLYTMDSSVAQKNPSAVLLSTDTDGRKYFDPVFLETKKFYTSSSEKNPSSAVQRYYGLDTSSEHLNNCDSVLGLVLLDFDFTYDSIAFYDGDLGMHYRSGLNLDFYYNSEYKTLCFIMDGYELYIIYDGSFFIFYELPSDGSSGRSEKTDYRAYQLSDGTSSYFINHTTYDTDSIFEYCVGTPPAPPVCNCDSRCTADSVNNDCPVCSDGWEKCTGTPPAPPECNCDSRCTADSVNNNCPVCSDDWEHCTGTPPVSHVCRCITQCTADSVNHDCELCNDDWSQCTGTPSADPVCNCDVLCTSDSVDKNCPVCSHDWKQCTGISDIPGPDNPDPDNPDPDNPDKPDDQKSIWEKIGELLASLLGIIESLLSPLIDGIIGLITMIMGAISQLTSLSGAFSAFLKATFTFIPDDILSVIGLGVMLTILASIVKIFL